MKHDVSNMTDEELDVFIEKSKDNIYKLLEDYKIMINENLKKIDNIKSKRKRAYEIINMCNQVGWVNEQLKMNSVSRDTKIIPRKGEIWTCELGQNVGSEENKVRPVIIIQNDTGNKNAPTTIVAPISNRPKKIAVHIELRQSDYILEEGEKNYITGTVLSEQIKVVSKARLGRHIATLKKEFLEILDSKLRISLDL